MANFAVMNGNSVTNIIVADTVEIAQEVTGLICIEYPEGTVVFAGCTYNPDTKEFTKPE